MTPTPTLPLPEPVSSRTALSTIVDALGLFFLGLEHREQLARSGGVLVLAAEYEADGTPTIGYRFNPGGHVADIAHALETVTPGAPA